MCLPVGALRGWSIEIVKANCLAARKQWVLPKGGCCEKTDPLAHQHSDLIFIIAVCTCLLLYCSCVVTMLNMRVAVQSCSTQQLWMARTGRSTAPCRALTVRCNASAENKRLIKGKCFVTKDVGGGMVLGWVVLTRGGHPSS